eukprot:scaffold1629_cov369-Prasinococcus_capsulatus_cf.AAC.15
MVCGPMISQPHIARIGSRVATHARTHATTHARTHATTHARTHAHLRRLWRGSGWQGRRLAPEDYAVARAVGVARP